MKQFEKIVTDRELMEQFCKLAKKKGYRLPDSELRWMDWWGNGTWSIRRPVKRGQTVPVDMVELPAYSITDWIDMVIDGVGIYEYDGKYYAHKLDEESQHNEWGNTPANACAKLVIYLLENNLSNELN
jgi:hypothetical protein